MLDVDGTLAPIVDDPEDAAVPADAVALLKGLAARYLLVACISGRRALDARRIVGLDELAYAGNHGLELLLPGDEEPRFDEKLGEDARAAAQVVESIDAHELGEIGLRIEDKGPIQAIHWRGARDVQTAERRAEEIAGAGERAGLRVHRGRMVLELRPSLAVDKGVAVHGLIASVGASRALYAGDDRTDLDAFRGLRELRDEGALEVAVCVGVASDEGPGEIQREADLVAGSPSELLDLLRGL